MAGEDKYAFKPYPEEYQDKPIPTPPIPTGQAFNPGSTLSRPNPTPANVNAIWDTGIDFARPFLGNAAATGAEALTAPVPIPGSSFAAGTAAYAGLDYLLKNLKTQQNTAEESFSSSLLDAFTNQALNKIVGGVFAGIKGIRNAGLPQQYDIFSHAPTTSQAAESLAMHGLATSTKFLEDYFARPAKAKALDRTAGEGFSQALAFADYLDGKGALHRDPEELLKGIKEEIEKGLTSNPTKGQFQTQQHYASEKALATIRGQGENPFGAIDDVLYNNDKLKDVLAAERNMGGVDPNINVREDLAGYQFRKMITDATDMNISPNDKPRINPTAINQIWNNPKYQPALETLYGNNKADADKLIKNILDTQDAMKAVPNFRGRLGYIGGGLFALNLPQLLQHMSMQNIGNEAATAAVIILPASSVGRLLTKPGMAKFITNAFGAQTLSTSAKMLTNSLVDALQGTKIGIQNGDGSRIWGQLSMDKDTGDSTFTKH